MNVCSKVQDFKEPALRKRQSFCRIQRIGFFEKAVSINNDLSRWAILLEYIGIIKSLSRMYVYAVASSAFAND